MTKQGTLRLQGSTDFYVDGMGSLCPKHRPDPLPSPQIETWTEYDRHAVVRDLIDEGSPRLIEPSEEKQKLANLLREHQ